LIDLLLHLAPILTTGANLVKLTRTTAPKFVCGMFSASRLQTVESRS
jgi:hypothetical protein